jgi:hypothetical protein
LQFSVPASSSFAQDYESENDYQDPSSVQTGPPPTPFTDLDSVMENPISSNWRLFKQTGTTGIHSGMVLTNSGYATVNEKWAYELNPNETVPVLAWQIKEIETEIRIDQINTYTDSLGFEIYVGFFKKTASYVDKFDGTKWVKTGQEDIETETISEKEILLQVSGGSLFSEKVKTTQIESSTEHKMIFGGHEVIVRDVSTINELKDTQQKVATSLSTIIIMGGGREERTSAQYFGLDENHNVVGVNMLTDHFKSDLYGPTSINLRRHIFFDGWTWYWDNGSFHTLNSWEATPHELFLYMWFSNKLEKYMDTGKYE